MQWWKRRPPRAIDLDPLDQRLLLLLARRRAATYRTVEAELQAERPATPADVVASLLKLDEAGLITRLATDGLVAEQRRFALTRDGARIVRNTPREPRSPATFYL